MAGTWGEHPKLELGLGLCAYCGMQPTRLSQRASNEIAGQVGTRGWNLVLNSGFGTLGSLCVLQASSRGFWLSPGPRGPKQKTLEPGSADQLAASKAPLCLFQPAGSAQTADSALPSMEYSWDDVGQHKTRHTHAHTHTHTPHNPRGTCSQKTIGPPVKHKDPGSCYMQPRRS